MLWGVLGTCGFLALLPRGRWHLLGSLLAAIALVTHADFRWQLFWFKVLL